MLSFSALVLWGVVASPEGRVLPVSAWAGSPERALCRGLQRGLPRCGVASEGAAGRAPALEGGEVGRSFPRTLVPSDSYSCRAGPSGDAVVADVGMNPQDPLRRPWARRCCRGWFSAAP